VSNIQLLTTNTHKGPQQSYILVYKHVKFYVKFLEAPISQNPDCLSYTDTLNFHVKHFWRFGPFSDFANPRPHKNLAVTVYWSAKFQILGYGGLGKIM